MWSVFKIPEWLNFMMTIRWQQMQQQNAFTKLKCPMFNSWKMLCPWNWDVTRVTVILDGYDDFIKDNLKDFNDIFQFCLKSTPPVQLLIIKESLIDYPLDMEDITDTKNNPILHSSEVFIMGFHHLPKYKKQAQNLLNIRHMLSGFPCAGLLVLVNSDAKDKEAFLHISRGKLCFQHDEGYWRNALLESQWLKYPIINSHFKPTMYLYFKACRSKLPSWPCDDWYINDYNWARVTLNWVQNYRQVRRRSRSLFSYNPHINKHMNKILSTNKDICLLMDMIPGIDYSKLWCTSSLLLFQRAHIRKTISNFHYYDRWGKYPRISGPAPPLSYCHCHSDIE